MDMCSQQDVLSDAGSGSSSSRIEFHSDEEVILATSRPKKRAGRRVFKETRHPIYRGVRLRNNNKWVCELREPNNKKNRIWLGTYPTPEMAARAHDVAALAFKGKSACLNFADSSWRLPVPASMDAVELRRTAKMAAEPFRPSGDGDGDVDHVVVVSDEDCVYKVDSDEVYKGVFMDEELVFDLPGLLADMAEGLLLSPPPIVTANDDAFDAGLSLWSFSF